MTKDQTTHPTHAHARQNSLNLASPHLPTQLEILEAAHPNSQQILQKQSRAFSALKNKPPETTKKRLYEVVRSFAKVVFWGPGPHNAMFNHYPTGSHSTLMVLETIGRNRVL